MVLEESKYTCTSTGQLHVRVSASGKVTVITKLSKNAFGYPAAKVPHKLQLLLSNVTHLHCLEQSLATWVASLEYEMVARVFNMVLHDNLTQFFTGFLIA